MSRLTGTKNFTVDEALGASGGSIPAQYQGNAQATLELLQSFREILGRPIIITSLYRTPTHNAEVPGHANDSQHLTADGADFNVVGMSDEAALLKLMQAEERGELPDYHQLISYAGDNHLHVGRGSDREKLVKKTDGSYMVATIDYLKSHSAIAAIVFAVVAIGAFFFPVTFSLVA